MTHALITGGAGFIGSHLAERLVKAGYTLTIIDNLMTGRMENLASLTGGNGGQPVPNVRIAIEDIRNEMVMDRLVSECDLIIHLAAAVGVQRIISEPIETINTNIGGTDIVLKSARRYRKKVLIASTSEVYGKGVRIPFSEDDDSLLGATSRSRWSYATSKAIDEFLAFAYHKEAGLPVVLFRLFNTVGPRQSGQYGMVVPRFVRWAIRNEPIVVYGDGEQQRCFCNVHDVIGAIHQLAEDETAIGQLFNIGNTEEISIMQLAERVRDRADSASPIHTLPYEEAYETGFEDFRRRVPNLDKIKRQIGWQPTLSLDETIDQIVEYERTQMGI